MTKTEPNADELQRAHELLYGPEPWPEGKRPSDDETAHISPRSIARAFAAQRAEHDARVTELLDANNRFEQRARSAERELATLDRSHRDLGKRLALLGYALRDMRGHAADNATQWKDGAGSHHHPIWARVAELLA